MSLTRSLFKAAARAEVIVQGSTGEGSLPGSPAWLVADHRALGLFSGDTSPHHVSLHRVAHSTGAGLFSEPVEKRARGYK